MTRVIYNAFDKNKSHEDIDTIVNTMPVDYTDFSAFTHYGGRMYGVLSGDDDFGDFGDFVVNACLREAVWRVLNTVQNDVEDRIGYNISPRYHRKVFEGDVTKTFLLDWPGLAIVDVKPEWFDIPSLSSVTVSPYLLEDLEPTLNGTINEYVLTLDSSVVKNPNDVILRNQTTNGIYHIKTAQRGYPRRNVGGDWEVVIDRGLSGYSVGDKITVQSKKFVYVDVTQPTLTGEMFPVYLNSNQIIRQAKPRESLGSDVYRYWFFLWELVDENFYYETVSLLNNEFYKLYQTISFKEFRESESKAILYENCICDLENVCCCTCDSKKWQLTTKILNHAYSSVCFNVDGELVQNSETLLDELFTTHRFVRSSGETYKIVLDYKTSPDQLAAKWVTNIPDLKRAITHRTAAELPLSDCGCKVKVGFIYEQQQSYGSVQFNPLTGDKISSFKYGDLHGQRVYAEVLDRQTNYKVVTT